MTDKIMEYTERFYRNFKNSIEVVLLEGLIQEDATVAELLKMVGANQRKYTLSHKQGEQS